MPLHHQGLPLIPQHSHPPPLTSTSLPRRPSQVTIIGGRERAAMAKAEEAKLAAELAATATASPRHMGQSSTGSADMPTPLGEAASLPYRASSEGGGAPGPSPDGVGEPTEASRPSLAGDAPPPTAVQTQPSAPAGQSGVLAASRKGSGTGQAGASTKQKLTASEVGLQACGRLVMVITFAAAQRMLWVHEQSGSTWKNPESVLRLGRGFAGSCMLLTCIYHDLPQGSKTLLPCRRCSAPWQPHTTCWISGTW